MSRNLNDQIEGLYDELIRLQIEHDWKEADKLQAEIRRLEARERKVATDQTSIWNFQGAV